MTKLIALNMPGGERFVSTLRRVWDDGDAAMPLDPRGPAKQTETLLNSMGASAVIEADGTRRKLVGGVPLLDGDALVVTTSGTTGEPKGVVHTHAGIEYSAFATSAAAGASGEATWLACLPLFHVGGLSVVTRALLTGASLVVHPRFRADSVDAVAAAGATHVSLVPTALRRIDATLWDTILLGGSAIPSDRPNNSIATYGMTETFGGVVYDGLALNGVEVRVSDESGEIELRTPTMMRAYRSIDDPTGADPTDHQGWFRTGDLGSFDTSTGILTVDGRADDLIITGGEKVWPTPVERVLLRDPRIAECAVIGKNDQEWGQRVVAVVVPSDPRTPPSLEDLRWLVRERLPSAAAPKELILVESLPRTSIGKIRRADVTTREAGPPTQ